MVADAVDMRAEVAVLTRSVVFQGDMLDECPEFNDNCDEMEGMDTFGGHIKVGSFWHRCLLVLARSVFKPQLETGFHSERRVTERRQNLSKPVPTIYL